MEALRFATERTEPSNRHKAAKEYRLSNRQTDEAVPCPTLANNRPEKFGIFVYREQAELALLEYLCRRGCISGINKSQSSDDGAKRNDDDEKSILS